MTGILAEPRGGDLASPPTPSGITPPSTRKIATAPGLATLRPGGGFT